jgi:hypothetical protein
VALCLRPHRAPVRKVRTKRPPHARNCQPCECLRSGPLRCHVSRGIVGRVRFDIPYAGSFQRGRFMREGDPVSSVWRQVERFGTVESLSELATSNGHGPAVGRVATIRVQQAVELHRTAHKSSLLTRPLSLYYSLLNLSRAALLAFNGEAGRTHGLRFHAGSALLECAAEVTNKGTWPLLLKAVGGPSVSSVKYSLVALLGMLPEVWRDLPLIRRR